MSYIDVTGKTEDERAVKALSSWAWTAMTCLSPFWSVPRPASWASAPPPPVSVSPMVPRKQTVAAPAEVKIIPETPAAPKAEPKPAVPAKPGGAKG